jgi:hypothetical protein
MLGKASLFILIPSIFTLIRTTDNIVAITVSKVLRVAVNKSGNLRPFCAILLNKFC